MDFFELSPRGQGALERQRMDIVKIGLAGLGTVGGGVCRVFFQLRAVDNVDGQTVYSLFDGHWDVTRENGRIVLGNPEVRKLK